MVSNSEISRGTVQVRHAPTIRMPHRDVPDKWNIEAVLDTAKTTTKTCFVLGICNMSLGEVKRGTRSEV